MPSLKDWSLSAFQHIYALSCLRKVWCS